MAHFIVEYTRNIAAEADIPGLLRKANEALIAQQVYPIGGIRSRAIELTDWRMADGAEDYAFVHARSRSAPGARARSGSGPETRSRGDEDAFRRISMHGATSRCRSEIYEFDEAGRGSTTTSTRASAGAGVMATRRALCRRAGARVRGAHRRRRTPPAADPAALHRAPGDDDRGRLRSSASGCR